MYLTAVIDWYSRYVLSWRLSNTMDVGFCRGSAGRGALARSSPEIFNTDQGSQFTSREYTGRLEAAGYRGEPGRSGARVGQRVRGAVVEEREIRRYLY